jgi:hypothetical protein
MAEVAAAGSAEVNVAFGERAPEDVRLSKIAKKKRKKAAKEARVRLLRAKKLTARVKEKKEGDDTPGDGAGKCRLDSASEKDAVDAKARKRRRAVAVREGGRGRGGLGGGG